MRANGVVKMKTLASDYRFNFNHYIRPLCCTPNTEIYSPSKEF